MKNAFIKSLAMSCAALLLAVGMLLASTTAFAQAPEETSSAVGLSSMDSGPGPVPVVYFWPATDKVLHTTTRGQWSLAEMPTPHVQELLRTDMSGNFDEEKLFGINWDEQEYISGLATGAASFTITGQYFPLNTEDQVLWDQGLILIDAETVPRMEIHVTQEPSLPFTVQLGYDAGAEGYYPIFSFQMPHGASEVLFEASNDGVTWISETQKYNTGAFTDKRNISSMQWLTSEEGHYFSAHQTSYYRVTVYGSAYDVNIGADGSVSTFILKGLPAETKPPDSDLDDSGGNRGGVGQEETDRVLPPAQNASVSEPGGIVASASGGVAQSPASTADSGANTSVDAAGTPAESQAEPVPAGSRPEDTPVMADAANAPAENSETPTKPAIPGTVTAAVCTVGMIIAALLLSKSHRKQG